ncbi:RNA polymerase sigma-70 factor [Hymenobacter sp. BT683]|uniref:RNA polymerase sigma-70 factor n=1 Tax=Hymenobacter jeongseonensis TaxID=2791027 RepID=A0ABS0ILN8_9BACT|nr:RNA polymerase sigma-70 factor [Hymenobacter jeongseonensis]MBF9239287.1 RNA polymerase sigma-70 factor [Hymenobacter jeongseonensis]
MKIARDFSELDCIRQLKLDDERAFDALFRYYSALVYRFAYSYLKSRVEAEETVQDCFLKIWEKRHELRADVPLKGYLFTIAHHAILNQLRRNQHHLRFQTHLATLVPGVATNSAEFSEMEALYLAALDRMPPKRRQIFILSRQQGLTYPEIAQQLNLSVKTVETQIMQSLKFLRAFFRAHGSEVLSLLLLLAVGTP